MFNIRSKLHIPRETKENSYLYIECAFIYSTESLISEQNKQG